MAPLPAGADPGPSGLWLVCGERVLAAVRNRPAGGWGRLDEGAVVLSGRHLVQTWAPAAALDVAHCVPAAGDVPAPGGGAGGDGPETAWRVSRVRAVGARRVCVAARGGAIVVVARRGAFERWGLGAGDEVAVRGG